MRDKISVEAEQAGSNQAILTVTDISMRKRLQKRFGRHNVKLSYVKLKKIGFPPGSMKDIEDGRPVRFRMKPEGYLVLLESVS